MMKRSQRGDAGAAMLVMMVVMMIGFLWYGGMKHGGMGHGAGSDHKSDTPASEAAKSPLDMLDEAYARGEIGRDEYLRKREDLLRR